MAKRESIWKANDGTEHRSKQSAAVADAEHDVRFMVREAGTPRSRDEDEGERPTVDAVELMDHAGAISIALDVLIKARAALAKHEAKGE